MRDENVDGRGAPGTTEPAEGRAPREPTLPVDGHVHLHSLEGAAATLDAAAANFRRHRGGARGWGGVLLLTQAKGERVFESLRARSSCGNWTILPAPQEDQSLVAERGDASLIVVCGRQIRCATGLEVTALGTTRDFPDGRPLGETVLEVQESGALASLPWGFGKWTGRRGKAVRECLRRSSPEALAVCDNGSRLQAFGRPRLIREASRLGYRVLPGSDPFPFGGDYRRVGSFGFFGGEAGPETPWRDLAAWLETVDTSPRPYGKALGPLRFLFNNIGIQLRSRRGQGGPR
ncbi:MAG: hypothetical protein SCH98_10875 [Deferrisomatales bacterium]|nr:hypothetical protein [Deferrisomatales bacterium]